MSLLFFWGNGSGYSWLEANIDKMIQDYLYKNIEAGDTLEGISRWWLEAERVNRTVDAVSNALENLSKTGEITRQKVDGSNPIL